MTINKKKLLIYPFGEQASPIIRHMNLIPEYELVAVVSPPGWGLTGEDVGLADNSGATGLIVNDNFDTSINLCDTVLFIDSIKFLDFKKHIYPKICSAINKRKSIIVAMRIDDNYKKYIAQMCLENEVTFDYFGYESKSSYEYDIIKENLLNISVPVVYIIGMAENTDKFEIQLSLRENLLKTEYKISQIGTRSYSEIFGMHNFPQFMYDDKLSEVKKILMFNRLIWEIEISEKPDIILVGIPGGIIPFNNNFTNRFGILAVEASMAVKPDFAILSIPFGDYNKETYIKLTNMVKHKLGFGVDTVILTNVMPEWPIINQGIELAYVRVGIDHVDSQKNVVQGFNIPVLNILNPVDTGKLAESLVCKLENYGETRII